MCSFFKSLSAFAVLQLLFVGAALAVNQAPVATMTAPASGTQFNAPATVVLSATASDPDGTVAKVEFYSGTTLLGPGVTAPPYAFSWTNVVAGAYSITAKAYDNLGKTGSSAAIQLKVINPTTVITSPANGAVVGRTVAVNGTYTGDNATVVIVTAGTGHSAVASSSAGSFSATVELARGVNTIEVQVARADGTFEIVDRSITAVDPPVIVMTAPTSNGPYTAPAQLSLAADAASAQGTITQVEFFDNSTSLGVATTAPYTVSVNLPAANHSIFARATDSFGFTADSRALPIIVQSQPPVVQITAPSEGSTFRAPATIALTATASDPDGSVTRVDYFGNGAFIGGATSAPYAVSWTNIAVGSYTITARATDNTGVTADSAPVHLTVSNNVPPSVALGAPSGSVSYRAPATINFSATASDSDGTVSKVEFLLNDVVVGTSTTAPYAATVSGIAAGSYIAKSRATDNDGGVTTSSTTANVTVLANALPTVSITSPVNGAAFDAPASVAISASASDSDGSIVKVDFFADSVLLGTAAATPYNFTWTNASLGSHVLTAKATDNDGGATTSAPVAITVAGITAAITSPTDGSTYAAPVGFTIQATAATSAGNITAVDFYDGSTLLQTIGIPSGFSNVTVSESLSDVAAGVHTYTVKGHDNGGRVGTSSAVTVTVTPPPTPPSVTLTAPASGSFYIAPTTLGLSADAAAGSNPLSKVDFFADGAIIGTANSAPYSITWANPPVGNHDLTARATDSIGTQATSATASIIVANAPIVTVDAGLDGSTIQDDSVLVTGTLLSEPNSGVTVNGITAQVYDDGHWAANHVPLTTGSNSLDVRAFTIDGLSASQTITVNRNGTNPIRLDADPRGGLAPQAESFVITNRGNIAIKKVEIDFTGDGTLQDVTAAGLSFGGQYSDPGFYRPRVIITAVDDQIYQAQVAVVLRSGAAVYALAKGVLAGLLDRLQAGDIDHALNRVTATMGPIYRDSFNALSQAGTLGSSAAQFGVAQQASLTTDYIELLVTRNSGTGADAYWIHLLRGSDGIWRIDSM